MNLCLKFYSFFQIEALKILINYRKFSYIPYSTLSESFLTSNQNQTTNHHKLTCHKYSWSDNEWQTKLMIISNLLVHTTKISSRKCSMWFFRFFWVLRHTLKILCELWYNCIPEFHQTVMEVWRHSLHQL